MQIGQLENGELDHEAPVFKVLNFLDRCKSSRLMPSSEEAADLRELVFQHRDNLNEPAYLNAEVLGNKDMDGDVIKYILGSVTRRRASTVYTVPAFPKTDQDPSMEIESLSDGDGDGDCPVVPFDDPEDASNCEITPSSEAGDARKLIRRQSMVSFSDKVFIESRSAPGLALMLDGSLHDASLSEPGGEEKPSPEAPHPRRLSRSENGEAKSPSPNRYSSERSSYEGLSRHSSIGTGRFHLEKLKSFTEILEQRLPKSFIRIRRESKTSVSEYDFACDPYEGIEPWQGAEELDMIGRDAFFDFVTEDSIVALAASPLLLTSKMSVDVLRIDLLQRDKNVTAKFLRFAGAVEEGYMSTGYHCKHHAADVTSRFVAIVNMAGIAVGESYTRLAGLTATMIHDYQHPQLTNQCLIVQARL